MTAIEKSAYKPHTLCEVCAKACGFCSWSKKGVQQPVEGWDAMRRDVATPSKGRELEYKTESYIVLACPEFQLEEHYRWAYERFKPEEARRQANKRSTAGLIRKDANKRKQTKRGVETIAAQRIPLETEEQQALFQWASYQLKQYPELSLLYHISNEGRRNPRKAKAEGIKAGVPDLCLPVPRGRNHGAYIEMKRRQGSRITPEQAEWMDHLRQQGYAVALCKGWEEAAKFLLNYLNQ